MPTDSVFRAIADPTRRQILKLLRDGEMTAGQITAHFDMAAPSMSHHFSVLKNADLIDVRRSGPQLYYSINTSVLEDVVTSLMEIFGTDIRDTSSRSGEEE